MPVHRVAKNLDFEERIAFIEKTERIVSVVADGDGCMLVFTEHAAQRKAPGTQEKRS